MNGKSLWTLIVKLFPRYFLLCILLKFSLFRKAMWCGYWSFGRVLVSMPELQSRCLAQWVLNWLCNSVLEMNWLCMMLHRVCPNLSSLQKTQLYSHMVSQNAFSCITSIFIRIKDATIDWWGTGNGRFSAWTTWLVTDWSSGWYYQEGQQWRH